MINEFSGTATFDDPLAPSDTAPSVSLIKSQFPIIH